MRLHDISAALRDDLPAWPGEEGMRRTLVASQPDDPATVSRLAFGAHTGTHVDAPIHFLPNGEGVETFDLGAFVGGCFVADLRDVSEVITGDDLEAAAIPSGTVRLLALTRNSGWSRSSKGFRRDYIAYDLSAAKWCVEQGIRLVGNDYLSIETFEAAGHPVHKMLLGAGVAVLEGVDLAGVSPGVYELVALPILIPGSDGAPVRAVLIEGQGGLTHHCDHDMVRVWHLSPRHDLYNGLSEVLGPTRAETLMTYLPAYDPSDVATQTDMRELRTEMREDFATFRSEMREDFAAFRSEMQAALASLDERMHRVMLTLAAGLFVVVASVIGLIGVVVWAM